jgi:hypothetical protein
LITKVKPNINSVEVHPQLSNNGHPVDGALVGAGSLWPTKLRYSVFFTFMDIYIGKIYLLHIWAGPSFKG